MTGAEFGLKTAQELIRYGLTHAVSRMPDDPATAVVHLIKAFNAALRDDKIDPREIDAGLAKAAAHFREIADRIDYCAAHVKARVASAEPARREERGAS